MLKAFIDDSASDHAEDKRFVLAGYIHNADIWERFADDWATTLAAPRPLEVLHMSAGFPGFNRKERDKKIDDLVAVLECYKPLSIEVSVSRKDYEEAVRPIAPHYLKNPYFSCFVGIMYGIANSLEQEGLTGPVDLVFDEQGQLGENATAWYLPLKLMSPDLTKALGAQPTFRDDREVVPLQAADFLAWHVRRCAEPNCSPRNRQVANAIRFRHRYLEVPREVIRNWAVEFAKVPGIEDVGTVEATANVRTFIEHLVSNVPPERLVQTLQDIEQRANRVRPLKRALERYKMGWLWRLISKRPFRL